MLLRYELMTNVSTKYCLGLGSSCERFDSIYKCCQRATLYGVIKSFEYAIFSDWISGHLHCLYLPDMEEPKTSKRCMVKWLYTYKKSKHFKQHVKQHGGIALDHDDDDDNN